MKTLKEKIHETVNNYFNAKIQTQTILNIFKSELQDLKEETKKLDKEYNGKPWGYAIMSGEVDEYFAKGYNNALKDILLLIEQKYEN